MTLRYLDSLLTGFVAKPAGDQNDEGALPILIRVDIADATGDTDTVIKYKMRVIDVWAQKNAANGGASDVVTVKNVTAAITSAIDLNVNDTLLARTTLINDANAEIDAGAIMRISAVSSTDCECTVYVLGIRV